jgi:hypothetical protein
MKVVFDDWRVDIYRTRSHIVFRKEKHQLDDRWIVLDFGPDSALEPVSSDHTNFRVADYDPSVLISHHSPGKHEYCVSRRVLEADVVLNVAKLKSHKLAGLTCCLKNMVGICGHKSYLPHFRRGPATAGHDEYPTPSGLKAFQTNIAELHDRTTGWIIQLPVGVVRYGLQVFVTAIDGMRSGCWHGNDTIWRTILDLNRIVLYSDATGTLRPDRQRRMLCVVDGIVAGEGDGPMKPTDRHCGVVLAGSNSLAVDTAAARLVGFPDEVIPLVKKGPELSSYPILPGNEAMLEIIDRKRMPLNEWEPGIAPFAPPSGWQCLQRAE